MVDLDEVIVAASEGKQPPQIVAEKGWDHFRQVEADCFEREVAFCQAPKIIACGGGIIETERGMALLTQHRPVVFIDRHINDILPILEAGAAHRASLGESAFATYTRRLPKYHAVSDFRFPVAQGDNNLEQVTKSFARFLRRAVLGEKSVQLVSDSFFVTLTLPHYQDAEPELLADVARSADVLEFRVDLLDNISEENIAQQVAFLRRHTQGAPILYTVRSVDHGGKFKGTEDEYFELNSLGLKLGCELLDVESTWSGDKIAALAAQRGSTLLIGSFHDFNRMLSRFELEYQFRQCTLEGAAAVAKVVVKGGQRQDNWLVQEVGAETVPPQMAFIGLCLGPEGRLSRVLNSVMCPAMHPRLAAGAPGQMSIADVLSCRKAMSLTGKSRLFVILCPWPGSGRGAHKYASDQARLLAKCLHRGFLELRLPHRCLVDWVENEEDAKRHLMLESVGGAVLLGSSREHLSGCLVTAADKVAQSTGFADCVTVGEDRQIAGTCSEAVGVHTTLVVASHNVYMEKGTGLVLGSVSSATTHVACAALQEYGFPSIMVLGGKVKPGTTALPGVTLIDDAMLRSLAKLDVVIISEFPEEWQTQVPCQSILEETLARLKPIVLEMAGSQTNGHALHLQSSARQKGCTVITAIDMLPEYANAILKRWTGFEVPTELIPRYC